MSSVVLYISHNGLTEPLGRRQVLPYIEGLGRRGWRFNVVSFEKSETAGPQARDAVWKVLAGVDAHWTPLLYHRQPPVLATIYDMVAGLWNGASSGRRPSLVHARSTVPAAVASILSRRHGVPWIFDVRGLIASEYADAGHWKPNGVLHLVTAAVERRLLRSAHGLVFLTRRITLDLRASGSLPDKTPVEIVPCMTDLHAFRPDPNAREQVRDALGARSSRLLAYVGSLGSWYRIDEMVAFFLLARREIGNLRLLVITPHIDTARAALERAGASAEAMLLSLPPESVPRHLAAADAGICFLGDLPSKRASSPTKYGEYLASGLPVITNRWTGDAAELDGHEPWILIDRFDEAEYSRAAGRLARLLARPEETRAAARALAEQEFGLDLAVDRYDRLFRRMLGSSP